MKLPFTIDQFFNVFEQYNRSVWPLQAGFYLLAVFAILSAFSKRSNSNTIISVILSFLWIWMGAVYHIIYFSAINKAAYVFGIAFIIQGSLFFYFGVIKKLLSFQYTSTFYGVTGSVLLVVALIVYPVLGYFAGHVYPLSPTFGLPCPTTIFTLGILLWTNQKLPSALLIIPVLWAVIGFSASFTLGVKEDFSLLIAATLFLAVLIIRKKFMIMRTV